MLFLGGHRETEGGGRERGRHGKSPRPTDRPTATDRQTGHFSRANWNRCPPSSLPPLSFTRSRLRNPRRQRRSTASGRPSSGLSRPSPVVRRVTRERGRGRAERRRWSVGRSHCLCNSPHIAATAVTAATAFLSPEVTSAESFNPKWPSYRPKGQSRRRPRPPPRPGLAGPPSVPSVVRPAVALVVGRTNRLRLPLRRSSRMGDPLTIRASDLALLTH